MYGRPRNSQSTSPMSSLVLKQIVKPEVHVLLVDHDTESLISIAKMLDLCSYKVTTTKLASSALEMLSNGWEFDVVIANINSPDMQAPKLLQEAVRREMLVALIAEREDAIIAERALQNGALCYLKKPPPMDVLKYLWQHVEGERIKRDKERGKVAKKATEFGNLAKMKVEMPDMNGSLGVDIKKNDNVEKGIESGTSKSEESESIAEEGSDVKVKNKDCIKWTSELHGKFMDAVNQLGEGKCYPSEILEIMNVPGLTRLQVASHLQKCRNGMWREPDEPRNALPPPPADDFPRDQSKRRAYGSMPHPKICSGKSNSSSSPPTNNGHSKSSSSNGDKKVTEYVFL